MNTPPLISFNFTGLTEAALGIGKTADITTGFEGLIATLRGTISPDAVPLLANITQPVATPESTQDVPQSTVQIVKSLLQNLQSLIKSQPKVPNPLQQTFAELKLDDATIGQALNEGASLAQLPSLLVVHQLEQDLASVGENLADIDSPAELMNVLQTKLNRDKKTAITEAKAFASAVVELVQMQARAAEKAKLQQHFLDADYLLNFQQNINQQQAFRQMQLMQPADKLAELNLQQNQDVMRAQQPTMGHEVAAVAKQLASQTEQASMVLTEAEPKQNESGTKHTTDAQIMADLLADTPEDVPEFTAASTRAMPKDMQREPAAQIGTKAEPKGSTLTTELAATQTVQETADVMNTSQHDPAHIQQIQPQHHINSQAAALFTRYHPPVMPQLENQFGMLIEDGGGSVKIKLNPEELGEVEIHLDIRRGEVSGRMLVQNAEVLEQLARDMHRLEQQLEAHGLKFAESGLELALKDDAQGEGQDSGGKATSFTGTARANEEQEEPVRWRKLDQLYDFEV